MTCLRHYRRDGTPYPAGDEGLFAWARALEGERRVAYTELPDGKRVSTVWIGLCHTYAPHGDGQHLIFETMVFPPDSSQDLDCERYTNEDDAKAGHEAMVAKWSKSTPEWQDGGL